MGSVNWRHAPDIELQARLDQPRHGLLFDIQNHSFWPRSWGTRPPANQAEQIARQQISRLPEAHSRIDRPSCARSATRIVVASTHPESTGTW